jgi:hypothetical protein
MLFVVPLYLIIVGYLIYLTSTAVRALRQTAAAMDRLLVEHAKLTAAVLRIEEKMGSKS